MDRRVFLKTAGSLPILAAGAGMVIQAGCRSEKNSIDPENPRNTASRPVQPVHDQPTNFDRAAVVLLDEIRMRGSQYFFDQSDSVTGIVLDRASADGKPNTSGNVSGSIAATGFGLSTLCVAAEHGYISSNACEQRILRTLSFLLHHAEHRHGFFPHFLDLHTGAAIPGSEFSSIDTALLLAGALHCRQLLNSAAADRMVAALYARVDWPWMLDAASPSAGTAHALCMGWLPNSGFLKYWWNSYSECLLMYLLAIGSPTHPIPAQSWANLERNTYDFGGIRFISSFGALFIHQYLHIWVDARGRHDGFTDYFQNSISAIRAHKTWCMLQHGRFSWIDERVWGFSASDNPHGSYSAWAAPPVVGQWDGTLSPHAAGGSLPLMPEESIVVLKAMREHYPRSFRKYGFVNAFNPGADNGKGWFDSNVIAGDLALTLLMAENQQTGSVRANFMKNREIRHAMQAVGFREG